jgi:hypothetical protein
MYYLFFQEKKFAKPTWSTQPALRLDVSIHASRHRGYIQAYIGLAKVVDKPTLFGSPFGCLRERSFVDYRLMLSGVHSDETLLSIVIEMGGKVLHVFGRNRKSRFSLIALEKRLSLIKSTVLKLTRIHIRSSHLHHVITQTTSD